MIKHIIKYFNVLLFYLFIINPVISQESPKNIGNALSFSFSYGYYIPGGEMADRFGSNFALGTSIEYLHDKSNLIFGVDLSFLFSNNVDEDVLASLRNENGLILGIDGTYTDIFLRERGLFAGLTFGKIFNVYKSQNKSGIRFSISPGIFQHWIRLQDDVGTVPQIDGDYKKGYDRFTSGFGLKEYIGYQLFSNSKRLNFYAGFEFIQGFTKNKRDINYDTQLKEDTKRSDFLWGFKVGWYIPFYIGTGSQEKDIFY